MTKFKRKNGILVPVVKDKPKKKKRPTEWNCPRCGEFYDSTKQVNEEATVGSLRPDAIPHILCPKCKKCMGCGLT